jgi:hypothetical protein
MLEKWRGVIATLSRALGLSVAVRDLRLAAGDAMARARAAEIEGDDLLARRPSTERRAAVSGSAPTPDIGDVDWFGRDGPASDIAPLIQSPHRRGRATQAGPSNRAPSRP